MNLTPYAMEPIVKIKEKAQPQLRWGELLYRGTSFPQSIEQWRPWYKALHLILDEVVEKHPFTLVSVNVDSEQLLDPQIVSYVRGLKDYPVVLEWTETRAITVGMQDLLRVGKTLENIRASANIPVVLDDICSGEDAFRRQCAITPDAVKIDGEVFQLSRTSPRIFDLLVQKVQRYEGQGVDAVIEWIETEDDLQAAIEMGATWGQGHLWSKASQNALKSAIHF